MVYEICKVKSFPIKKSFSRSPVVLIGVEDVPEMRHLKNVIEYQTSCETITDAARNELSFN